MSEAYSYDRPFRLKVIALCLDDSWMSRYGNFIIKPEYFEQADEEAITSAILTYREKYGCSPTDTDDVLVLTNGQHKKTISIIYKGREEWDLQLAGDEVVRFAKEQAAKLAILDSVDDVNKGDIQSAIDKMKSALSVGELINSPGIDPIRDVDTWLYEYWSTKVRTGWTHVDNILEGGISAGEMGIIMAPQNRGKSMSLINLGYGAASIGSGKNVVHFTHEMRQSQVAKRYAARITFRFPSQEEDLDHYATEIVEAARRLLVGHIRIIGGGKRMTIHEIDSYLHRLEDEGFEPDLIIDDYPDLLVPPRRYKDRRFELSEIYSSLRSIAEDHECVIWGASQSRRTSHSKEIITLEDIAEDIGKASIADIIISLCQTREEEDMEQCRLFMAKVRDGKNHSTIAAKFYGVQQAIITTGIVIRKSDREQTDV